jgi:hypothetical protein
MTDVPADAQEEINKEAWRIRGGGRAFLLSFAVLGEKKYIRYGGYRRFSLGLVWVSFVLRV